ncbi:MAG: hypothetical protein QOI48_1994 [Solirubrobacteraceae bacterium]|jgi:hypothetical protein|nr:hypothetical protein [Solirubrobacteraceae bacterium]
MVAAAFARGSVRGSNLTEPEVNGASETRGMHGVTG